MVADPAPAEPNDAGAADGPTDDAGAGDTDEPAKPYASGPTVAISEVDVEAAREVLHQRREELLTGVGGGALDDRAQGGLLVDVARLSLLGFPHGGLMVHACEIS